MGKVTIRFALNRHTAALVYLAQIYHLDMTTMLFLYEKLGRDLFYIFFMLSGKTVTLPKASKLLKIFQFGEEVKKGLEGKRAFADLCVSAQEKGVLAKLQGLFDKRSGLMIYEEEVVNNESTTTDIGDTREGRVHLPAATSHGEGDEAGGGSPAEGGDGREVEPQQADGLGPQDGGQLREDTRGLEEDSHIFPDGAQQGRSEDTGNMGTNAG